MATLEPDVIGLALADALQQLQETRLLLSVALEVASALTAENRRLQERNRALLDDRDDRVIRDAGWITPQVMFGRKR